MTTERDLGAEARAVVDRTRYMVIGTADASGTPWTTPVYFSHEDYADFYWVSSPVARHSENIAVRPEVSIVVFDSTVPIGGAEAVYMSGAAALVPDGELERCSMIFRTRDSFERFGPDELRGPGSLRLYRASVAEHHLLIRGSDPLHPSDVDARLAVDPRG